MTTTIAESSSDQSWAKSVKDAARDLLDGIRRWETWRYLAWHEIRRQYQRSVLGPLWLTLNMGVLVVALGWFYSGIFGQDITYFLPYVALGFMVFGFMSTVVNDACQVFLTSALSIKQSNLPLSFYAFKLIFRSVIIFLHNFIIYVLIFVFMDVQPGWLGLLALPGFALMILAGFFLILILGPFAARYRDVPPIVANLMQVFFLLTPVFWVATDQLRVTTMLMLNPFHHFLAIVRKPLLGEYPEAINYVVSGSVTVGLAIAAFLVFARFRSQVAFWV